MTSKFPEDLIYASFFFIDIVGLSNPILSTETQRTKIKKLNELIYGCKTFGERWNDGLLMLPTGDGMLIGFQNGLEEPLKLAMEFHKKLSEYNDNVIATEQIETRIGCHIGHVFVVKDVLGNMNLWGPGAILARRIMDMGDSNHILVSGDLADDLFEVSKDYEKILKPLHNFGIKHGEDLLVYSAYGENFGNSEMPREKIKINALTIDAEKNAICKKMIFNIILKDDSNFARLERYFYFGNNSSEPIYEVVTGIVTNSEEEFKDLNLSVLDEKGNNLKISKILATTPYSKKIIIQLDSPVFDGDSGRLIKMVYDVKLFRNNFENFFLTDTEIFELNFSHYSNILLEPQLHYIDNKEGSKIMIDPASKQKKGLFTTISWKKTQGIHFKDLIRLEW